LTEPHPLQALQSHLEIARLKALDALAANQRAVSPGDLKEVAVIQAALVAVREEIAAQIGKLGWGTGAEPD
jgi:hypothetical protein